MIIYYSLVDASSVIRKQRFLHDAPFWPLPEPLLAVTTIDAFQCTYTCTTRVDCCYSYNKPAKRCYLYADQPGAPVVTKAQRNGNVFYILHLHVYIRIYSYYSQLYEKKIRGIDSSHVNPCVKTLLKENQGDYRLSYDYIRFDARWDTRFVRSRLLRKTCKYCFHQVLRVVWCVIHTKTTMVVIPGAELQYYVNKFVKI